MKILCAPVQGHTDAAWRHFHAEKYGPADGYTTPFIRLEKGEARNKDLNDAFSLLNDNHSVAPQVIFRNLQELSLLVEILKDHGCRRLDINMGCPFPLQTGKGRGAATVVNPEAREALKSVVLGNPDIDFSLKLRLGMKDHDEWKELMPVLNELTFSYIVLHPRVAKQQYNGDPDLEAFGDFLRASRNPVLYNGDIRNPEDFFKIYERFPEIDGVMLGRGLLARPSLASEIAEGRTWFFSERLKLLRDFHNSLFNYYKDNLTGGDHQVLSKIKPFWEYSEPEIGRKAWKAIKKASNMAKYHTALALINNC